MRELASIEAYLVRMQLAIVPVLVPVCLSTIARLPRCIRVLWKDGVGFKGRSELGPTQTSEIAASAIKIAMAPSPS